MATVYHALDSRFEREVAIKVLPPEMLHDPQFRIRFEDEVKMVAGLEHSAIVPVYDVGEENGMPYFVMRYMPGGSLATRIAKGRLPLKETARIIAKIAPALAFAHKKGVIHRDLKPDNILFDNNNEPFISDFGVAKLTGATGSLTSKEYVGTPTYMSPEQTQGEKMDGRSDVYSLGAVIYEMLTGQPPYQSESSIGMALKHVTQPVPKILKALPSLPDEVDVIIKTSMAKDKGQRYATPIELARALNLAAFGNEGDLPSSRDGLFNSIKTGLILTSIILVIAIVGFFVLRNQLFSSEQSPSPTATSLPPTFTAAPTNTPVKAVTSTLAPIATEAIASPSSIPFAPSCSSTMTILTPAIKELDKTCVEKNPYTLLSISEGATFQSLNPAFSCKIENTHNGKSAMSCTGTPAFSFDLKICTPPTFSVDLNKCAQDSVFDSVNQCCMAAPTEGAGCTIFKVDIRSCP
jgi:serine/threonine protein kinase